MLDKWLSKTKLKAMVEKLVKKLFLGRISANQLTVFGLILGLLSAFFIFLSGLLTPHSILFVIIGIVLMVCSFVFDALDGTLARMEQPTLFGGVLDMFCDRSVEVFIIIALISTDSVSLIWPGIFTLVAIVLCITMFLVVGGAVEENDLDDIQKVIFYRKGLMERSETFIFLVLITLLIPFRFILLWLFAFLIFATALLRLRDAYLLFNIEESNQPGMAD